MINRVERTLFLPFRQFIKLLSGNFSGSLIQFDKSCEEMLELCIGEHRIAEGLAVKVGEKFGLKVNKLTPPTDRVQTLKPAE